VKNCAEWIDKKMFTESICMQGQGTVLTGTMLSGTLRVGDEVELPEFGVTRKVKTIQQFKVFFPVS